MQTATVSASVAGHGLSAAQRSELVVVIEDLRHDAWGSKPFRQACSTSLLKLTRALKDLLRKRAWLKLHAAAAQDKKEAWRQEAAQKEAARQEAARQEAARQEAARRQKEADEDAAGLARVWACATTAALAAERCAAGAARAAAAAKYTKAMANEYQRLYGGEGGSGGAAGPSEASEAAGVLDAYVCPITADIMTDPVCTSDGFTYERRAITEWLRTKDTSPSTGAKLESKRLIPNITVRCLLQDL